MSGEGHRAHGQSEKAKRRGGEQPQRPRAGGAPIIELRDVTKVYPGGHMALDRVSLAINRGEFAFLVGPTGCGKSTLIKTLIREVDITEGSVNIAGRDIGALPEKKIPQLRRNIGTVFQDFKLLPDRTVYDNVAYALQVIGASRARDPPPGAGDPAPGRPLDQAPQLSRPALRRASSSASRSPAPSSTTRRCCSPTSRAETSTRSPRSGSCSCSTGSTRPARRSLVVTHDREMVDNMRRRVIELYEGRVVRDEVSGGYTEESTTEFGLRMRAEMGVGAEGGTNGHDAHDSLF